MARAKRGQASKPPGRSVRIVAAALAALPLGFFVGAMIGGRILPAASDEATGRALFDYGLAGAAVAALIVGACAAFLPRKATRIMTPSVAVASFIVLGFLVQDFIVARVEATRAFTTAYEGLPAFHLALATLDADREPFSSLSYDSKSREYTATRPGGWVCRGQSSPELAVKIYRGAEAAGSLGDATDCAWNMVWQIRDADGAPAGRPPTAGCAGEKTIEGLLASADELVVSTQRHASCRRPG